MSVAKDTRHCSRIEFAWSIAPLFAPGALPSPSPARPASCSLVDMSLSLDFGHNLGAALLFETFAQGVKKDIMEAFSRRAESMRARSARAAPDAAQAPT